MSNSPDQKVRPSLSSAGIAKRRDAVRFAIANTEIEGLSVSAEAQALLERWARGEIDDDELLNEEASHRTRRAFMT